MHTVSPVRYGDGYLYVDMLAEAEEEEDVSSSLQGWLVSLLCLSSPRKREKKKGQTHIHAFSLSLSLSLPPSHSPTTASKPGREPQPTNRSQAKPALTRSTPDPRCMRTRFKKKKLNTPGGREAPRGGAWQTETDRTSLSVSARLLLFHTIRVRSVLGDLIFTCSCVSAASRSSPGWVHLGMTVTVCLPLSRVQLLLSVTDSQPGQRVCGHWSCGITRGA